MSQEREVADRVASLDLVERLEQRANYEENGGVAEKMLFDMAALLREAATAIRTAREEGYRQGVGARVKPLVWGEKHGDCFAASIVGLYRVISWRFDSGFSWSLDGSASSRFFDTLEAAQAAAQRDYEQRIMSALAEPGDGWQSMDSAPRDGTHFLAWEPGEGVPNYYECWWYDAGGGVGYWADIGDNGPMPENWRPLLSPPPYSIPR